MTALRRLNEAGIAQFAAYLQQIRNGAVFHASPAILHVDEFSSPVDPPVHVASVTFENKFDAAKYLAEKLAPLGGVLEDVGLWSWLALYYFEQLSPAGEDGKRRPRQNYHYIPTRESGWLAARHLLAEPYGLYLTHGVHARLLLYPKVHEHGAFVYDLGHRRELIANRGLIEAIDILYWDPKRNRPKRGAASDHPGSLRRLIAVLQQLDFNYDLFGMTAHEILALLPPEFDPWQPAPLLRGERDPALQKK